MPTRDDLEKYSEEELVLLLKYILIRRRDRFDSIVSLQYFYEITVILACKLKGYSLASTRAANKEFLGFNRLADVRNIFSHDLISVDDNSERLTSMLESHIVEKLAVTFLGDISLVGYMLEDIMFIVDSGYKSLLESSKVETVNIGGKDILVSELVKDLPESVKSKYNSEYTCLCDNIGRMIL